MPRTVGRKASRTTLCSSPWAGFGPRLGGGGLLLAATDSDEPSMEVVLPERAGPDAYVQMPCLYNVVACSLCLTPPGASLLDGTGLKAIGMILSGSWMN